MAKNGQIHLLFVDYVKFTGFGSHAMMSQKETDIKNVFRVIKLTLELEGLIIEQVIWEIEIPTRFWEVKQTKNPASLQNAHNALFEALPPCL